MHKGRGRVVRAGDRGERENGNQTGVGLLREKHVEKEKDATDLEVHQPKDEV